MNDKASNYTPKTYVNSKLAHALKEKSQRHAHFTDVNGKDETFIGYDFSYCLFKRAYFHNTTFVNCNFTGARFEDCNFRNASIDKCDFRYATFNSTFVPTDQMLKNLPDWPNVRRELLQILRRNAASVGDYRSEKIYVVREIDSEEEHFRRAWKQDERYYKEKYGEFPKRIGAGLKLLALRLDNFMWGRGERLWKAPIALAVLLFLFSMLLTGVRLPSSDSTSISDAGNLFWKAFIYHINLFLDVKDESGLKGLLVIDWIVVIARYVAIGLVIAALYRRLSHR